MSPWFRCPSSKTFLVCSRSLQRSYSKGSTERQALEAAIAEMEQSLPFEVPCVVNGKPVRLYLYYLRGTTNLFPPLFWL